MAVQNLPKRPSNNAGRFFRLPILLFDKNHLKNHSCFFGIPLLQMETSLQHKTRIAKMVSHSCRKVMSAADAAYGFTKKKCSQTLTHIGTKKVCWFCNLYIQETEAVRGLEAVYAFCIPPTAGKEVVKKRKKKQK